MSSRFWIIVFSFLFVSRYFLIFSLTSLVIQWLFSSVLFSFHIFVLFLFVVDSSHSIVAKKDAMISAFINLPRLVLWPSMWSLLKSVLCVLKKNVYCAVWGWNVLYILSPSGVISHLRPAFAYWFSVWSVHLYKWGC